MNKANTRHYARRINRVIDYMYAHLDEELSLECLSQVANFSKYHFHRQFTEYTGISVYRLVQLMRLRRASMQLVFNPQASILDIALDAGFETAESFSRAFKKALKVTPTRFRKQPQWESWHVKQTFHSHKEFDDMQVQIVDFPRTLVAALEYQGPESRVYGASMTFIEWRRENGISPEAGNTYGVHYSDPASTLPEDYRLDLCVSVAEPVADNPQGVVNKVIPAMRCALARHLGSRNRVTAAEYLYREWLPASGEEAGDFPVFFHYVNVGPDVRDHEMITDVYLPLK